MSDEPDEIRLDGASLTPEQVAAVAREGASVSITDDAREALRTSRERVEEIVESGEVVYGLNTGFGELVDERIPPEKIEELQTNLIRSHAAGAGRELRTEEVRAMMLTRINALVKGYSGIREVTVDHLLAMLNGGVHPVVKSRGSLGASGDLAPLAHMSLVLLGEGTARVEPRSTERACGVTDGSATDERAGSEATRESSGERSDPRADHDGERLSGDEALDRIGLEPLSLRAKEGLALINGTQLSVGIAALLVVDAERAVRTADVAGGLATEVTMGTTASCDPAIHEVRPHPGQLASARNVKRVTADSEIVESHRNCDRVQDAYSIRCIPQVHGAVRDAVAHLRDAVEIELNSATDNPLIFDADRVDDRASGTERAAVLSGGNFHGEPLALRLDYLTNAVTELAAISERRVDRMLNPNLQEPHLPPFLTPKSGLRSGYMIAQYTAAALLNENRAIGRPSMDNTPVSGGQEDHVSMSAQSAFDARRALDNVLNVLGIELLCGAQAAEFIGDEANEPRDGDLSHGVGTAAAYDAIREVVPPLVEDRPVHADVEAAAELVRTGLLAEHVEDALGESLE